MFGSIGLPELMLIFIIALLLFGPRKLPEIGKTLGKAMNEFKRASNDLQRSLEEEVAADELKAARREVESAVRLTPEPGPQPPAVAAETAPLTPGAAPAEAPPPPEPKPTEPK